MTTYLDTQLVVWLGEARLDRLTPLAQAALEDGELAISPMVLLELEYLYEIHRIVRPPLALAQQLWNQIGLEIMWSRLVNVVDEMWLTVCRTAFSLIISEAQDFACELLDANGETLAHSPRAMPVFNLCLPRTVKALLAKFPPATLRPGDVLVTNDPWLCAGHLFDIAVLTPVFRAGRLVGLVGTNCALK